MLPFQVAKNLGLEINVISASLPCNCNLCSVIPYIREWELSPWHQLSHLRNGVFLSLEELIFSSSVSFRNYLWFPSSFFSCLLLQVSSHQLIINFFLLFNLLHTPHCPLLSALSLTAGLPLLPKSVGTGRGPISHVGSGLWWPVYPWSQQRSQSWAPARHGELYIIVQEIQVWYRSLSHMACLKTPHQICRRFSPVLLATLFFSFLTLFSQALHL